MKKLYGYETVNGVTQPSRTPEPRALTDAELIAVAALAQVDAIGMKLENEWRAANNMAPAYARIESDAIVKLEAELRRRGAL